MCSREWVFPGGRLDTAETFEQGMLREIHEEVGMIVIKTYTYIKTTLNVK